MDRGRWLLVAAIVAGVALLVFGRPGADDGPDETADQPPPSATSAPPPPPPAAPSPTGTAASPTSAATPAPAPPHEEGGVTGEERLAPADAGPAVAAAERFAAIWSAAGPNWHDRLAELATPALGATLAGADPPQPAREVTGAGTVYFDAPEWARVGVPADGGTVVLDVVAVDGRWLVSAVDWRSG